MSEDVIFYKLINLWEGSDIFGDKRGYSWRYWWFAGVIHKAFNTRPAKGTSNKRGMDFTFGRDKTE